ncbi:phosphopyruvate hydratase [Bifidobacterium canis]|uniref:Enolase n=1 Tax=Bifidobacterium canis TaxID=2610880 RepID=A0A7K1J4Q6_9BIFI|nr:phosphopyruvate hydratase [Bifidobacterium canis]MUH59435.1 enolase [Bifidobacterium canis]
MSAITDIKAYEILDSRGNPTVEVELECASGANGHGLVPSGASTGSAEAVELRDGDPNRYQGKGVLKAVENVNTTIKEALIGKDASDQRAIDRALIELDGTPNKGRLGANAILGVSLAALRASAQEAHLPLYRYIGGTNGYMLPVPCMNVLNGGAHADSNVDIQEFMLSPIGFDSYHEALRANVETYHTLKSLLKSRSLATGLGDEGGFAPNLASNAEAFELLVEAIEEAGYKPGEQIALCFDAAATEFYDKENGVYNFDGAQKTVAQMTDYYTKLIDEYPIISIEDPFEENAWSDFADLTSRIGDRVQIVGDDIFVTNPQRLSRAIREHTANSILIKLNQIGSVTETLDTIRMAWRHGFTTMVSHRSGETTDTTIADLTVGTNAMQLKSGAPARGERIAKYNRLAQIERELGDDAQYAGRAAFAALNN